MGVVLSAYDPQLDRKVAVKMLKAAGVESQDTEAARARLVREAQALARLAHPNVVSVFDVGTVDDQVFIAMEYVPGRTLSGWLKERPRRWHEVVALICAAGHGLAAAHRAHLIHRDFKPDNVLVGQDERPRVTDFGLVGREGPIGAPLSTPAQEEIAQPHFSSLQLPITSSGTVLGTPAYMAPEQFHGGQTVDARADQFAFAVVLWEALYGQRPFGGTSYFALRKNVLAGELIPPPAEAQVPEGLHALLSRALSVEPDQRYGELDELLRGLTARLEPQPALQRRRVYAVAAAAAVLAAGVAAAGVTLALRPDPRCKGSERLLQGVWDADRRAAMKRAYSAYPDGETSFERTAGALDDYARRWAVSRDDTCAATRVRGDQPESVMSLKMECLDLRLHELQYLTTLLAAADQKLVERGVDAATGLSSVRSCADATSLTQEVPLPEESKAREAIRQLKEDLTEVNALRGAGRYKLALEKVTAAVEHARSLGYPPVEAEALLVQGYLLDKTGDNGRAADALRLAVLAADAGRSDRLRARAAIEAVFALALHQDYARAEEWASQAQAVLDRKVGDAEEQGDLLVNVATLHSREGQDAVAAAELERARQLLTSELGHDDPRTLNAAGNLAYVYQKLGRLDEALALLQETTTSARRRLGPDHPLLVPRLYATALVQLQRHDYGSAHRSIDEVLRIARKHMGEQNVQVANALEIKATIFQEELHYQDALATYRQALAIQEKVLRPGDQLFSYSYDGIGQSLLGLGHPEQAHPMLEKALAIRGTNPEDLADTHFALARTLWQLGKQKAAALRYADQAMGEYRRAGKAERAAGVEGWLAKRK